MCFIGCYNICNVYVIFITVCLLWAKINEHDNMPSCPVHVSLLLPLLLTVFLNEINGDGHIQSIAFTLPYLQVKVKTYF